ncbi:MAG TPA: TIGR02452 family protein [Polyangiaceae bacterium]|jgi:uncharacterized protein (TIGR02452 family)
MSLATIGKETVEITNRGWYTTAAGARVSIQEAVGNAVEKTVLYRPEDYASLEVRECPGALARFEVTPETTGQAARRLVEAEGAGQVAALNFASAKNPGGGFLGNARAQEEDLARCSALYACQIGHPAYYDANRAVSSMLYTDHLLYSPEVPFFRDERLELLATPFKVSVLTSPAPNAGEAARRGESPLVRATLERRAAQVLRVAAHHRTDTLVLGAWGCGVFRNDPTVVAAVFRELLTSPPFARAFTRVVFAIYDRSESRGTLKAFERAFVF